MSEARYAVALPCISRAFILPSILCNADKAQEVVTEIEKLQVQAIPVQADVSKVADIHKLFDQTIERFGKVDILVNNAGITFYKLTTEVTEEDFDKIFAINVKGTYFACQQAAQRMTDGGRIINFSSSTTAMMLPKYGAYVATKGAVEQMTRVLAILVRHKRYHSKCGFSRSHRYRTFQTR